MAPIRPRQRRGVRASSCVRHRTDAASACGYGGHPDSLRAFVFAAPDCGRSVHCASP